jgi:hypothetical protein
MTQFCVLVLLLSSPADLRGRTSATKKTSVAAGPQEAAPLATGTDQGTRKNDGKGSGQSTNQSGASSTGKPSHQSGDEQKKTGQTEKGQQTKRMLWVVPNFAAVSANVEFTPLTAREKFHLAADDSFDYSSFTWTAIEAGQGLALNSDPEFGHGVSGYGRYYWHNYVDGVSGTFFTEAIVPALTHEDPRYFTMGEGGFWRRTEYALSRTFLTKTDSGDTTFNWSEVGGNALEAGLSNAYYPAQERTFSTTMQNWGVQMESAALNNLAKEFWPDIRHKILHQK